MRHLPVSRGVPTAILVGLALAFPAAPLRAQVGPATPKNAADTATARQRLAPDFIRTDLAGQPVRLSSYRGKVVLLNFWATWCEPCRVEAPTFSTWQKKYGRERMQVIGVSMDDDVAEVRRFVAKFSLAYPIVLGDAQLGELYGGILGLPVSYVIDTEGRVAARYQGATDLARLEERIAALLPRRSH